MKSLALRIAALFFLSLSGMSFIPAGKDRSYYEVKIYTFKTRQQQEKIEAFLKNAYLPALHRSGISKVGVFSPVETDTATFGKKLFVFVPYTSIQQYLDLPSVLANDKKFQEAGEDYLSSAFDAPSYSRLESILLYAFEKSPKAEFPVLAGSKKDQIYELRSYESASERLYINKVKMFNTGDEVGLFKRLGFNAVFYGEVVAGSHMPNLMYMTSFENMAKRDEHWKTFSADPQWKTLVGNTEYQHNVSKADVFLLHPAEFSDL